ncbi:hypothetical protein F2Q70_00011788 [Brassica cretica]|uniref:Uncharacterized protein n=1 Tax=Brassica cretica TaxID=69181 RepID=A0A8S9LY24_BRACR|nr:hypothetical protein F2Q70_00011788 [Brassica cretica]KAF3549322.1 hypothetical protein DY000_02007252 [Brassica cretica]
MRGGRGLFIGISNQSETSRAEARVLLRMAPDACAAAPRAPLVFQYGLLTCKVTPRPLPVWMHGLAPCNETPRPPHVWPHGLVACIATPRAWPIHLVLHMSSCMYSRKADLYNLWFLLVSGLNYMSSLYNLWDQREQSSLTSHQRDTTSSGGVTILTNSESWRSQKRSSWKYCRHTKQPLRGGYNALAYFSNSSRVVPRKKPCPNAGNTADPPPAKEPGKMLLLHQGVLVFISSTHLEQMGEKGAGEHMFPLLFIQKKKPNLRVPGSSFQVPDPSFQVPDPSFRPP